jgi:hypothetical protein
VGKRENEREGEGLGELGGKREGAAGPMGPKGARGGGWAGQGGPRRGRGREKKGEERERKRKRKRKKRFLSPFRNLIFLDECTYISKQSKNA